MPPVCELFFLPFTPNPNWNDRFIYVDDMSICYTVLYTESIDKFNRLPPPFEAADKPAISRARVSACEFSGRLSGVRALLYSQYLTGAASTTRILPRVETVVSRRWAS
jgi:hypothetical protein